MPEGDTIHYAARRIRPLVEGRVPEIAHPNPRLRGERWPEKLAGRAVARVDAHGKHLFVRFEGDLTIHAHLRMTGSWGTYRDGQRWRRATRPPGPPPAAWTPRGSPTARGKCCA